MSTPKLTRLSSCSTGIGGGGFITLGQVVISDVVSLRQRGTYQGILGAMVALCNGIGPVIGGALASQASWRDIFRLMLPLSACAFVCVYLFLPLKKVHGSAMEKIKAIDWVGAVLTLCSSVLIVVRLLRSPPCCSSTNAAAAQLGLTWGGGEHAWDSAYLLVPLLLGVAIGVLFCLWEWKGTPLPLMPLRLFHKRIVVGGLITQVCRSRQYGTVAAADMTEQFINGWVFLVQVRSGAAPYWLSATHTHPPPRSSTSRSSTSSSLATAPS